jgi:hypothetical protein
MPFVNKMALYQFSNSFFDITIRWPFKASIPLLPLQTQTGNPIWCSLEIKDSFLYHQTPPKISKCVWTIHILSFWFIYGQPLPSLVQESAKGRQEFWSFWGWAILSGLGHHAYRNVVAWQGSRPCTQWLKVWNIGQSGACGASTRPTVVSTGEALSCCWQCPATPFLPRSLAK